MQTKLNKIYAILGASIAMLGLASGASGGQTTFITLSPEDTVGAYLLDGCTAESECGKAKTNIEKRKSVLRGHVNRGSGYSYGQARKPASQANDGLTTNLPNGVDLLPSPRSTSTNAAGDPNSANLTAPGLGNGVAGGSSGGVINSLANPAQGILEQ